jgi:hypothetical protein
MRMPVRLSYDRTRVNVTFSFISVNMTVQLLLSTGTLSFTVDRSCQSVCKCSSPPTAKCPVLGSLRPESSLSNYWRLGSTRKSGWSYRSINYCHITRLIDSTAAEVINDRQRSRGRGQRIAFVAIWAIGMEPKLGQQQQGGVSYVCILQCQCNM